MRKPAQQVQGGGQVAQSRGKDQEQREEGRASEKGRKGGGAKARGRRGHSGQAPERGGRKGRRAEEGRWCPVVSGLALKLVWDSVEVPGPLWEFRGIPGNSGEFRGIPGNSGFFRAGAEMVSGSTRWCPVVSGLAPKLLGDSIALFGAIRGFPGFPGPDVVPGLPGDPDGALPKPPEAALLLSSGLLLRVRS